MKCPSSALVWEIWQKNRWAFALLGLLFAGCAGISAFVVHLQERVRTLSSGIETGGTLTAEQVLPLSPTGLVERVVRFKLNSDVLYEGVFSPRDKISWSNDKESLHLKILLKSPSKHRTSGENWKNPPTGVEETNSLPKVQELSAESDSAGQTESTNYLRRRYGPLSSGPGTIGLPGDSSRDIWRTLTAGPNSGMLGYRLSWSVREGEGKGSVFVGPSWEDRQRVTLAISDAENWREAGLPWSVALMGFSVLVLFVIFGGTEPQEGRGFTGVPPRRFTLPVRTSTLVAWPLLLGSASILMLVVAWSRLVFPHLLPQGTKMPEGYLSLLLLAGLSVFQAIVWGLPSFPKTRVTLLTILICTLLGLVIYGFADLLNSVSPLEMLFGGVWPLGAATAWLGVHQERRGAWAGWQKRSLLGNLLRRISPHPRGFRSALHAQVWFEWKRNCRVPLLVWTLLVCLILGAVFVESPTAPHAFNDAVPITLLALACFLIITGLNLARDGTSKKLALSSFTSTRPVSTGSLLTAKLVAGLKMWLSAILILGFSLLVADAASGALNPGSRWQNREAQEWTTGCLIWLAVCLQIYIGILPVCLSGKIPGFPWSLLPMLLLIGGIVNAWLWFARHQWAQNLLCTLLSAMVVLKLIVAFWGFRRAIACRLVSRMFVSAYVALWLIATGVLLFMVRDLLVAFRGNIPSNEIITACVLAALLAVPLARIALSPLALVLNRHR